MAAYLQRTLVRVLHIVPALFGPDGIVGGAERYALELARHMAAHTPTRLVSFGDTQREERIGDLTIRVIGNPWYVRSQRSNPFSISLLAELRNADVAHCHQQHIVASTLAAVCCRLLRKRVFVTDLGGGGWDISGYVSTDRWYNGHLHLSEYSRSIAGHAALATAHIIGAGVDNARFCPDDSVARQGNILFVGRILPHKGINYLIESLPPGLKLDIVGRPYDPRYLSHLMALSAGKRVEFHHDYDDRALLGAYRSAMCVVLPSVYRTIYGDESRVPEIIPLTLIEAMACGTPVICSSVAGLDEVVEDGVTGFVVPPNDTAILRERIAWLRDHPEAVRVMGENARKRVCERFTWPAVVHRCLSIYHAASSEVN